MLFQKYLSVISILQMCNEDFNQEIQYNNCFNDCD